MSFSIGTRATFVFVALALALMFAPVHVALAQHTPSASETALARQEFDAGMRAARDARWEEARQHFARSYELAPRPVTLLNLAGAQAQTRQLVAASESYRRFLATATERDAERFRAQAESALAASEARIGHASLHIDALAEGDEVRLDDAPISRASLTLEMPLDPGDHVVTVHRRGAAVGRTAFEVRPGASSTVRVAVRSIPTAADTALRADPADEEEDDEPSDTASVGATTGPDLSIGAERAPDVDDDDEGGSVFASPWFWLVTVAVIAGGVTAAILLMPSDDPADPFQGTLMPGVIIVD